MTRDGRRQVGIGRTGVGTVTVVTVLFSIDDRRHKHTPELCPKQLSLSSEYASVASMVGKVIALSSSKCEDECA